MNYSRLMIDDHPVSNRNSVKYGNLKESSHMQQSAP